MKRKILSIFGTVGLLVGLVAAPSAAQPTEPQTLNIDVGAFLPGVPAPAESMRFLAPELTVNRGDVLNFRGGFHTATAIPAGEDPAEWIAANLGLGGPFALNAFDPDEGPTAIKYNNAALFPSAENCGPVHFGAPPCPYDGSETLNSGVLFFMSDEEGGGGFSMEIDAPPGSVFYIICIVHPSMVLKVTVANPNETPTRQAEIDAFAATTVAADTAAANETHQEFANKRKVRKLPNGKRLHQAWGGIDGPGFALFEMYPLTLNLRKGDKVKWNFNRLHHEVHSVTMPKSQAKAIASGDFVPVCDPDGDQGSAPDTPADFDENGNPSCPEGSELEIDSSPRFLVPEGDGRWRGGNDLEHSAVRSPNLPSPPTQGANPYKVAFKARTGDKPLKYACVIHTFMDGRINVKRAR